MKIKRQKDAETYQKMLQEQIDEKNLRKLKTNAETSREKEKMTNKFGLVRGKANNNSVKTDRNPAVSSSRYSNTNTACTRDLFTPSEDNCLSQHLANYSTKKPERVVSNSD